MAAADPSDRSPTTSIWRVLISLFTGLLLALLFDARGVVHSGQGMQDGPVRSITLAVGEEALAVADAVHLTWPWDSLQAALGRNVQPATPPLLASGTLNPPAPVLRRVAGPRTARAVTPSMLQMRSTRRQRTQPAAGATGHPLRVPTRRTPLRILTTGDSLMGYIGPEIVDLTSRYGPVRGFNDIHNGTGLTRPDFVDWSVVARQQVAAYNPDAVVVLIGGNDFQNMTLPPNRFFLAGSPAWTREYQRRAEICMRIWAQGGVRRVYWLSVPPARNSAWAYDDAQINLALQRAAAHVPGAEYLNVLGRVTDHGRYADFVSNPGQPPQLVRQQDGVHLNITGSDLVAREVVPVLVREWRLGSRSPRRKRSGPAGARFQTVPRQAPGLAPRHVAASAALTLGQRGQQATSPHAGLRTPTPASPLELLVTGDSLTEYLAPRLVDEAVRAGPVRGLADTHYGTGLTRPDYVDWSVVAAQQVRASHPNAVVVMMGGNDFQNMTLPSGKILRASTPAWTREYQRRAAMCMRVWAQGGGSRVYWLSIPPARGLAWARVDAQINLALQRAAAHVPGAKYLNILGPVTDHGRYADFVRNAQGQPVLVREPDGVHLNLAGSEIVAREVLAVLTKEWHLHR